MQQRYLIITAAAMLLLAACGSGQGTSSTLPAPSGAASGAALPVRATGATGAAGVAAALPSLNPSAPPEITLATIQKKATVDAKDPLVQQFAQQLDALGKKCTGLSRQEMATEIATINQGIQSAGVHETLLDTISGINKAIPANNQDPCPKQFAAYASTRLKSP